MEITRKILIAAAALGWLICCLFLNGMGGYALIINDYRVCGICLLASGGALAVSLLLSVCKKLPAIILSAVFDIAGSALYIYPISVITAIPSTKISKAYTDVIAGRMYPAIIVTALIAVILLLDYLDPANAEKRAAKKQAKLMERTRSLEEHEKII